MAKKKSKLSKSSAGKESPFGKYRDHIISAAEDFAARELGSVVDWLRSLTNIKTKIRKMTVFMAMSAAGATLVLYGITRLLMDYFPTVRDGMLYIIIGIIGILLGMAYRRV